MDGESSKGEPNRRKRKKKFGYATKKISKRNLEEEEIANLQTECSQFDSSRVETFNDFPLSSKTKHGLSKNKYTIPTGIQKECIGLALQGCDILGAAKTGSGKTLAFLIPVLEVLYRKQWTRLDGLGALIITPTRELALQIYETLCKVGFKHDFSAGLIIGGKDLVFERSRMHQVNIVICTPGRILQHMDENPLFDCVNMQILVLDEADRCMDLGFEKTMNSIIENLPEKRQTLLFSATQTKNVKDLVRLSLKDPKYVSIHEHAKHKTPESLTQSYMICEQHEKLAILWSFIKSHLKQKVIVFLSTCHQVKFIHTVLTKLRPGISLFALHGRLHQLKRMDVYHAFCNKQFAVLFATDIAARGLDFPEVNWVIQLDCPEDVHTYIHRAGRTARYHKGGECLLALLPSEINMVEYLEKNKIPTSEIKVNPNRLFSPQAKFEAFLAKDPELKASAQRAFVSYAKAVYLMKDKTVFNIKAIDTDKYARSLGLVISPRIRFLQRLEKAKQILEGAPSSTDEGNSSKIYEGLPSMQEVVEYNPKKLTGLFGAGDSESEEENVLVLKKKHLASNDETDKELPPLPPIESNKQKRKNLTKVALAKRALKKNVVLNKKIIFSDEGEVIANTRAEKVTDAGKDYEEHDTPGGIDIEEAKKVMREEDKVDRKLYREKVKAKRWEKKRKLELKNKKDKGEDRGEEDDEESGSSGEDDNLSWLPDPDKVYNNAGSQSEGSGGGSDAEERSHDGDSNNVEEEEELSASEDGGMTLKEEEELALKFLSSKR